MTNRTLVRRHNAVLVVVLAVVLVFAGRLVYVQALEGPRLAEDALSNRLWHSTIQASRGDILDANGEVLATSVQRYNAGVNQLLVRLLGVLDRVEEGGAAVVAERRTVRRRRPAVRTSRGGSRRRGAGCG